MNGNISVLMKRHWKLVYSAVLLALSALLYYAHFLIFKDAHHIFLYLLGDIAFVPVSVLLVTLVLEHILETRQKEVLAHKLNMVLGVFFSEVGQSLLKTSQEYLVNKKEFSSYFLITSDWSLKEFGRAKKMARNAVVEFDLNRAPLADLKDFLSRKREFLLMLLENPNLLEHEKITDMLMSIFHLVEELEARISLSRVSGKDQEHLTGDMKRVFTQLVLEWIEYMEYLKMDYPYLFSLAVRTNPFDPRAKAEVG